MSSKLDPRRKRGPYFMELVHRRVARDAIPDGGGVGAGIDFLLNPERIRETTRAAFEFVQEAVDAVRAAPDNPYGDDEEAIAKHIVEEIEKRWEQKKKRENR